jgi:anthranilate synthase component 1
MLARVDAAGVVTTHPIAGTRRRGATPAEDAALAAELLGDAKERAEHIMLVDLGRNDVGRVAAPGSVRVTSLMGVEKYSHVQHIVSVVEGALAPGRTPYDALRSIFPAGTVSGAPKVRAMQLVASLERAARRVYAGGVGYASHVGDLDAAIAIRTLVVAGGAVHLQAGAGIVADSDPAAEYDETLAKLRATMRAVDAAAAAAAVASAIAAGGRA